MKMTRLFVSMLCLIFVAGTLPADAGLLERIELEFDGQGRAFTTMGADVNGFSNRASATMESTVDDFVEQCLFPKSAGWQIWAGNPNFSFGFVPSLTGCRAGDTFIHRSLRRVNESSLTSLPVGGGINVRVIRSLYVHAGLSGSQRRQSLTSDDALFSRILDQQNQYIPEYDLYFRVQRFETWDMAQRNEFEFVNRSFDLAALWEFRDGDRRLPGYLRLGGGLRLSHSTMYQDQTSRWTPYVRFAGEPDLTRTSVHSIQRPEVTDQQIAPFLVAVVGKTLTRKVRIWGRATYLLGETEHSFKADTMNGPVVFAMPLKRLVASGGITVKPW